MQAAGGKDYVAGGHRCAAGQLCNPQVALIIKTELFYCGVQLNVPPYIVFVSTALYLGLNFRLR